VISSGSTAFGGGVKKGNLDSYQDSEGSFRDQKANLMNKSPMLDDSDEEELTRGKAKVQMRRKDSSD